MDLSLLSGLSFPVKCLLLLLLGMSVLSWAIMCRAWINFRRWDRESAGFVDQYNKMEDMPSNLEPQDPLSSVFKICISDWDRCLNAPYQVAIDCIEKSAKAAEMKWFSLIYQDLNLLDIVASSAPYIGILGTVLGIGDCFFAVASSGVSGKLMTLLSSGVAEALTLTAAGLLVAIPAMCGSYQIRGRTEWWERRIYCFLQKMITDLVQTRES